MNDTKIVAVKVALKKAQIDLNRAKKSGTGYDDLRKLIIARDYQLAQYRKLTGR